MTIVLAILFAMLPPCATEDSSNCSWDSARGNGLGSSFVDVNGTVYPLEATE